MERWYGPNFPLKYYKYVTILDIDNWDRVRVNQYSQENSSLEQNSLLHNQIYTWYYQFKGKGKFP